MIERTGKFMTDDADIETCISDCGFCERLHEDGVTCTAFPDGIPDRILVGLDPHRSSIKGDHGIFFKPRK